MKFLMLAIKYIATTLQTYFGRKGALAGWKGALAGWKGALAGCFCNREFYLYHIACLLRDPSKKKYFDYMFFKEIFQFIFASLQVLFFLPPVAHLALFLKELQQVTDFAPFM